MTFFVELATGLASNVIVDQIEELIKANQNILKDTVERVKDGSLGIFIFGPQGTGKTTLMNVLSGDARINDLPPEYDSSTKNQSASFAGHLFYKVHSGPGQETLADIHWPQLFKEMQAYTRVVCIFCCSYGCHASFETAALSKGADDFLYRHRGEESKTFAKFCEQLSGFPGKLALMLLITKQDLWWDAKVDVERHYSQAAFSKGFRVLEERKRSVGFVRSTTSASLSIQNLLTAEKALLVPTVSGYDALIQRANYLNFLKELDGVVSRL